MQGKATVWVLEKGPHSALRRRILAAGVGADVGGEVAARRLTRVETIPTMARLVWSSGSDGPRASGPADHFRFFLPSPLSKQKDSSLTLNPFSSLSSQDERTRPVIPSKLGRHDTREESFVRSIRNRCRCLSDFLHSMQISIACRA